MAAVIDNQYYFLPIKKIMLFALKYKYNKYTKENYFVTNEHVLQL